MVLLRFVFAVAATQLAFDAAVQSPGVDPTRSDVVASPLRYRSAFADYRPLGDDGRGNWKEVNDRVRDAAARAPTPTHGTPDKGSVPIPGATSPMPQPAQPGRSR